MIEVIYKEDKEDQETVQEPFSMPRNVRQIGLTEWQQCLPERFNGQQI